MPGIAAQYSKFALIRSKAKNGVQRSGLSGAVGPDKSENAALFDVKVYAIQRDVCAEGFAQATCFDTVMASVSPRLKARRQRYSAVLPPISQAAGWSPESEAILLQQIFFVRPSAADCARLR